MPESQLAKESGRGNLQEQARGASVCRQAPTSTRSLPGLSSEQHGPVLGEACLPGATPLIFLSSSVKWLVTIISTLQMRKWNLGEVQAYV